MNLQNVPFVMQLGQNASIRLANAVISTGNDGATIQFGSVNFDAFTAKEANAQKSTSATRGHTVNARNINVVRETQKKVSVFERLGAPG
ncbi:hypothetical protein EE085_29450, partial [Klebsiella pneumoniae]|nr:hypothetical protein [Klebsiella pneumoniae]